MTYPTGFLPDKNWHKEGDKFVYYLPDFLITFEQPETNMNLSLYELTNEYQVAMEFITDPENEIDDITIADTLESLEGTLQDKMLNVGRFIDSIESMAEKIKENESKQKHRRISLENKAEKLRDYLINSMFNTGFTKVSASDIALSIANLPGKVIVDDEDEIPDEYFREQHVRIVSKQDISNAIKSGDTIPGCHLESGFRLVIK